MSLNNDKNVIGRISSVFKNKTTKTELEKLNQRMPYLSQEQLIGIDQFGIDNIINIKTTAYLTIREQLSPYESDPTELNKIAYQTWLLFRSYDKALHYAKTHHPKALHDNKASLNEKLDILMHYTSQFFPASDLWSTINFENWGDFLIKCKDKDLALQTYSTLSIHTSPIRHANKAINSAATTYYWSFLKHKNFLIEKHGLTEQQAYKFFLRVANEAKKHRHVTPKIFNNAFETFIDPPINQIPPDHKSVPNFQIDGKEFGMTGCIFKRLDYNDPRILFIGAYTNCCERYSEKRPNITSSIVHALETRESAFYVVEDAAGKILTHSWVWKGSKGDLCFDGFESYPEKFKLKNLKNLTTAIQNHLKPKNSFEKGYALLKSTFSKNSLDSYNINGVFIGTSANHLETEQIFINSKTLFDKFTISPDCEAGILAAYFYPIVLPDWFEGNPSEVDLNPLDHH